MGSESSARVVTLTLKMNVNSGYDVHLLKDNGKGVFMTADIYELKYKR